MNLGAGRVVHQDFTRINQAIADGSINQNNALLSAINATDNTVHILGMLSDGGVHSHQDQLFALIDLADQQNASRIVVHAFLDGRDVPPQSAAESLKALSDHIGARRSYKAWLSVRSFLRNGPRPALGSRTKSLQVTHRRQGFVRIQMD